MRPITLSLPILLLSAPAMAAVPQVVTDIPAVQSLVAQVMGDLGTPAVLLDKGANAHSYQLRPSQARTLQSADLVVWVGPEMTPWLERALDGVAGGTALELLEVTGVHKRAFDAPHDHEAEDAPADAHADAHDHDHVAEAEDEDGHIHDGLDPHAWLDPANAQVWLAVIAEQLAAADPENAATYAANAQAAVARIAVMDREISAQLQPVQDKPFVVAHAAYGYFADHYGLTVAGAVAMGDATAPGAAHLTELRADLQADGVVCAFPEAQHDPKQMALLIEGTGVRLGAALDPSGSSLDYGPGLYEALMRDLSGAISTCLSAD
jgi:zinc transport system substrate-binding protein